MLKGKIVLRVSSAQVGVQASLAARNMPTIVALRAWEGFQMSSKGLRLMTCLTNTMPTDADEGKDHPMHKQQISISGQK